MANKIIGFTIEIEGNDKLISNLDEATAGVKQLKKQLKETTDQKIYEKLEKDLVKLTAEQKRLQKERRKQIKDQQRVLELAELEEGSYRKQEIILAQLKDEYKKLGKAKRESADGKKLLKDIKALDKEVKKFGSSIGENFRNVGNYFGSFSGPLNGLVDGFGKVGGAASKAGKLIAGAFVAFQAISLIVEGIGYIDDFVQATREAQNQVAVTFGTAGEATDNVTAKIQGLAGAIDSDFKTVLDSTNAVVSEFGGNALEATDLVAKGFQSVADRSGFASLLENNLQKVSSAGLSASESIALLAEVSNRGINIDVISKGIANLRTQTDQTKQSIENAFGEETANKIFDTFEKRPADAVKIVSAELQKLNLNSKEAAEVVNSVFGRSGKEDLTTIENIAKLNLNLDELAEKGGDSTQRINELREANERFSKAQIEVANSLKQITGTSQTFTTNLKTGLLFVLNEIILAFKPVIDSFKRLAARFQSTGDSSNKFKAIINGLLLPFKLFAQQLKLTIDFLASLIQGVDELIKSSPALSGFINRLKNLFDDLTTALLNLPALFSGISAAVIQTGKNISSFFKRAFIEAQIFTKQVEKLNPFGKTSEQINSEIRDLKKTQSALSAQTKSVGEAFGEAYNAGLKKADDEREAARKLAAEQLNEQRKKEQSQANKQAAKSSEEARKARKKESDKAAKDAEKAAQDLLKKQTKFTKDSLKIEANRNKLINQLSKQLTAAQIANIQDDQTKRLAALENGFKSERAALKANISGIKAAQKEQIEEASKLFGADSNEVQQLRAQQQNELLAITDKTNALILEKQNKFEADKLAIIQKSETEAAAKRLEAAGRTNALLLAQEKTKLERGLISEEEFQKNTIQLQRETSEAALKELNSQIAALESRADVDKDALERIKIKREEVYQDLAELDEQDAKNAEKSAKDRLEKNLKILDSVSNGIANAAGQIDTLFGAIAEKEAARLDSEIEKNNQATASLEERLNNASGLERRFLQQQLDEELKNAEKLEKQKAKLEQEEARRQKRFAIGQAIINGALAITKTFASLGFVAGAIPALGQAAATAVQIATISQQQFAGGGIVGGGNIPRQPNGDNVVATLKTGEVVLNENQQAALGGASTFAAAGVPGFASGGAVFGARVTPSTFQNNANLAAANVNNSFEISEATRRTQVVLNTDEQLRQKEDEQENISLATLNNDSNV